MVLTMRSLLLRISLSSRYYLPLAAAVTVILAFLFTAGPLEGARCFHFSEDVGTVCDGRAEPEPDQFQEPVPRDESLLDWVSYAYMKDNINIYPEPNSAARPIYNVGEGFLYITVQKQLVSNGQSWYQINPGQFALADGIVPVKTPAFHGTEISVQPERPFGWIVQEVVPSSGPDEDPDPDQEEMARFTFFQVFDAVVGEGDWIWYDIGGDRWIRQTSVSLIDVNPVPEEIPAGEYWVEVDLFEQTFAAYEGTRMVYAGLISSGLNRWPTEEGLFQVWSRYLQAKMSGAEGKVDYYFIEDIPYIMYFDRQNEIALHGAYWHDRYGYKHSHGCVNMPPLDAEWVYYWSAEAPNDLWVWVHTSDPMLVFEDGGDTASSLNQLAN